MRRRGSDGGTILNGHRRMAAEPQILVELVLGLLTDHNAVDPALSSGEREGEIGDAVAAGVDVGAIIDGIRRPDG